MKFISEPIEDPDTHPKMTTIVLMIIDSVGQGFSICETHFTDLGEPNPKPKPKKKAQKK